MLFQPLSKNGSRGRARLRGLGLRWRVLGAAIRSRISKPWLLGSARAFGSEGAFTLTGGDGGCKKQRSGINPVLKHRPALHGDI